MSDAPDPIEGLIEALLKELGEDPGRDGLVSTPIRVAKTFRFLTGGYSLSPLEILNGALFDVDYDEMVLVRDIEFYSLCEHHLLPFIGKAHVAYLPDGKVIGLSKIPRIVDMFARRLQIQENLTVQIAECVQELIGAKGVGVVIEAKHLCMMMRGVAKQNSSAMTSCLAGSFRSDPRTRSEFLDLVRRF
mgnify:CR=1 FL=1